MKKIVSLILVIFCFINYIQAQDDTFKSEEVSFENGENKLSGTLTLPKNGKKFPAIILISGSGAQDRDETILGFKPFKIIAEYLSENGFAVLRYDDRGVGKSKGRSVSESTSADFAEDVKKAVALLKKRQDIDARKIGLLGHSEGGAIAPMVAARNADIAFIVLMAGYGVSGAEISLEQSKAIGKMQGLSEEYLEKVSKLNKLAYKTAQEDKGWEELEKAFEEIMPEHLSEAQKKQAIEAQIVQLKTPWFRYYVAYNPQTYLKKTTCPTLVLFGALDTQVIPKQNKEPIENALKQAGNKDYTIKTFEKANHLFQEAKTGSPMEYATLDKEFVEGFLPFILEWLKKRV